MTLTPVEGALKMIKLYRTEITEHVVNGEKAVGVKSVLQILDEIEGVLEI